MVGVMGKVVYRLELRVPQDVIPGWRGAAVELDIEGYFNCSDWVGVTMPNWLERNRQWGRGVCGFGRVVGG